ncbi:hypothetical protein AA0323_0321 [Asaia siamensis NRIC 0323]|nr:hypothetical protein AA0323_0321 [Asaia siamensis NRIC 0323]
MLSPGSCCCHKAIKPVLMAIEHWVGMGRGELPCRGTILGFLRQDAQAILRHGFNKPGMMHIKPRGSPSFTSPTMPCQTSSKTRHRRNILCDLCLNGKPKRRKPEPVTQ